MQIVRQASIEKKKTERPMKEPVTTVGLAAMRFAVFHNPVWPRLRVGGGSGGKLSICSARIDTVRLGQKTQFCPVPGGPALLLLLLLLIMSVTWLNSTAGDRRVLEDSGKNCYGVTDLNVPVLFLFVWVKGEVTK